MKKSIVLKIISISVTFFLIWILLTHISINEVLITILNLNPAYVVIGFSIYICTYFLRSWRFHILLNNEVSIIDLFYIGCIHNLLNNLLPARTGELSYVYLLKTEQNKNIGVGLGSLVIAKILDFVIVSFFFLIFFLNIRPLDPDFTPLISLSIFFLFMTLFLFCGLLFLGDVFLKFLKKYIYWVNFRKYKVGTYLIEKSEEIALFFKRYKKVDRINHILVIILSLGIWIFTYLLFYVIAINTGIQLQIIQIFFGSSFAVFTTILPIQGIGGFGTMEGGWALGFITVGAPNTVAIYSGFAFHIICLLYSIILGTIGYIQIYYVKKIKNQF